jgi:glycosyltransferase involved in cell wall biosynthesis
LVDDGVNGFVVDPHNVGDIAERMRAVATDQPMRKRMGEASERIVAEWGLDRFATSMLQAASTAIGVRQGTPTPLDRLIVRGVLSR